MSTTDSRVKGFKISSGRSVSKGKSNRTENSGDKDAAQRSSKRLSMKAEDAQKRSLSNQPLRKVPSPLPSKKEPDFKQAGHRSRHSQDFLNMDQYINQYLPDNAPKAPSKDSKSKGGDDESRLLTQSLTFGLPQSNGNKLVRKGTFQLEPLEKPIPVLKKMGTEVFGSNEAKINLDKRKSIYSLLKFTARHEIYSMTGYNPGYDKENQDFSCFHSFTSGKEMTRIYVMADGHGPNGHVASKVCSEIIVEFLEKAISSLKEDDLSDDKIKELLTESYKDAQGKTQTTEDDQRFYKYSGTTMVVVLIRRNTFYLANCGDSRAFLASQVGGKMAISLVSKDHKPEDPEEKKRVETAGGKVVAYREEDGTFSGPQRVWNQAETEPGLATSRSLGDLLGHKLGCIPIPDVYMKRLDQQDKFFMMATDGVWEYLSCKDVMEKVIPYLPTSNVESCCKKLVSDSAEFWAKNDDTRDDISVLLAFIRLSHP